MTSINLFDLSGKNILVTGGTGHLGSAMCTALVNAGANVFVNARNIDDTRRLCESLVGHTGKITPAIFDILSANETKKYFQGLIGTRLDAVVNNAYKGSAGTVETSEEKQYQEAFEIGIIAVQRIMKLSLPFLRKAKRDAGDASIVNISSMYGRVSPKLNLYKSAETSNPPFYGAVKAGLEQLTRYSAVEFGPEGIRVNSIAPGPFPSTAVQCGKPKFIKMLANEVPLKRIGQSHEIGGSVVFLISGAASYISGACIRVDGGWTIW